MSDVWDPEVEKSRDARRDARGRQRELDLALVSIMESPLGRKWIWNQLSALAVFHSPFGSDVYMTYFAGGEKNVGLRLFADLMRVCPNLYLTMAQEHYDGRSDASTGPGARSGTKPGTQPYASAFSDSGDASGDAEGG